MSQDKSNQENNEQISLNDKESNSNNVLSSDDTDVLTSFREAKVYDDHTNNDTEREYHTEETTSYWLPKDEDEQHRLTGQHFAIKELFEGNVLPKVHEFIDFNKGVSILDVGCGSGVWVMDMMTEYPNCTYEGCDIVDLVYKNVGAKQINFSFGNVVEGLKYPDNSFDLVHMRLLVLSLREVDWPIAIRELLRVTKPGGIIHLIECDFKKTGGITAQKFVEGVQLVCKARGQDPRIVLKLEDIINEVGGSKIIETSYRSADLSGEASVSKKFRWDWEEAAAAIIPIIGPMIGVTTKEEQKTFLEDLHQDYITVTGYSSAKAFVFQKL